jgi:hypothetical protein
LRADDDKTPAPCSPARIDKASSATHVDIVALFFILLRCRQVHDPVASGNGGAERSIISHVSKRNRDAKLIEFGSGPANEPANVKACFLKHGCCTHAEKAPRSGHQHQPEGA